MTKEQRNLLQGVKVGSIVSFTTNDGYDEFGKVVKIHFTWNSAELIVVYINHSKVWFIDIEQVNSIITNKKITRMFGVN